jgi:hypothetical protein
MVVLRDRSELAPNCRSGVDSTHQSGRSAFAVHGFTGVVRVTNGCEPVDVEGLAHPHRSCAWRRLRGREITGRLRGREREQRTHREPRLHTVVVSGPLRGAIGYGLARSSTDADPSASVTADAQRHA